MCVKLPYVLSSPVNEKAAHLAVTAVQGYEKVTQNFSALPDLMVTFNVRDDLADTQRQ